MQNKRLIIGSRKSRLALAQAKIVADILKKTHSGVGIEIKTITTTGDKILDAALAKIGTKGLFTKEIEEALLKKEIDIAVHSMKDLPVEIPGGLEIIAITKRENPQDVLVSKNGFDLESLPKDSKVGTSSLRRQAQLLNKRPDLKVVVLRGNLDTRIRKLGEGLFDAIILAYAGIKRLNIKTDYSVISLGDMLPPAGQGALGIEIRQDDAAVKNLIGALNDCDSYVCVSAERALLKELGGGCQAPLGVYACVDGNKINIKAGIFSPDARLSIKDEISGDKNEANNLAKKLAGVLIKKGAGKILDSILSGRKKYE